MRGRVACWSGIRIGFVMGCLVTGMLLALLLLTFFILHSGIMKGFGSALSGFKLCLDSQTFSIQVIIICSVSELHGSALVICSIEELHEFYIKTFRLPFDRAICIVLGTKLGTLTPVYASNYYPMIHSEPGVPS